MCQNLFIEICICVVRIFNIAVKLTLKFYDFSFVCPTTQPIISFFISHIIVSLSGLHLCMSNEIKQRKLDHSQVIFTD